MDNIGNNTYYEKINHVKLIYILQNRKKYESIIEKDKTDNGNANEASIWAIMKKMYKNVIQIPYSEYGYIAVKYVKGKSCNNIGRWYAENGIGLAPIKSCIRHTLCDDMWVDIDQVNSHPVILNKLMSNYQYSSGLLNNYINNREDILNAIMNDESCSRDDAKNAVISTINGKKYKTNTLLQLHNEIKPGIDKIMKSDEYKDIYDYCKKTFGIKSNMQGKVMSRILQVIENNMLECYINMCCEKGLIPKYKDGYIVSLVFDGFQLIKNDAINDDLLEELRLYAKEETGYDVKLKLKPFDKALNIPDDYNLKEEEIEEDDEEDDVPHDLKSYGDFKKEFELTHVKITHPPSIYTIDDDKDEMQNFKSARDSYGHFKCYIDKSVVIKKKTKIIKCPIQFVHQWMGDKDIKLYKRITWKPPPLISNECDFNTWKPFDISKVVLEKSTRNYYKEFLTFCENLFESKEVMNYLLARYAFKLQNPGLRSNVCVVYYGEEGGGKSMFVNTIYKLFGKYAIQIDKAKRLYESHSTFEKEKCFICVNEAGGCDNFENSEVLKTRITEDKLHINPKGVQAYEIDNLCDYDMTTNNINVVKITDSSTRRWFQHECSSYYLGNMEFFNDYIKNILDNTNAIRQIYDNLLVYDWKDIVKSGNFQDANYKPETNIVKQVKECNRDKLLYFYKYIIDDFTCDDNDNVKFNKNDLFKLWINWCSNCKINLEMNNIQFGMKTSQLNKKVKAKTGNDFIDRDTNSNISIYRSPFNLYYNNL
tara:strand:+ start:2080 stop:4368 length:2289 start_codon:yes stop_codon:yes gene_type:complete